MKPLMMNKGDNLVVYESKHLAMKNYDLKEYHIIHR
jgi:hypothetical protein